MPPVPFVLEPGAELFYVPGARAKRPPVLATLPDDPLPAKVHYVHGPSLVDLVVTVPVPAGEDSLPDVYVRFVPFVRDGEPDPLSPMGRCHVLAGFTPRDYTAVHEVAEGLRRFDGESDESWAERQRARGAMVASGKMKAAPGEQQP